LYVLATRGLSARKDSIPFGPFLALGGILAFFL
jgi:prepilin signal peptidase PulO-like enzyme (type II secretory pathway)